MITELDPDIHKAISIIDAMDPTFIVVRYEDGEPVEVYCCDTYEELKTVTVAYENKPGHYEVQRRSSRKKAPWPN